MCLLGLTWIFGCFQFDDRTVIMSYLFTVSGSLQGVMMFVFHCLFSKQVGHCDKPARRAGMSVLKIVSCSQVREEYGNMLSTLCAPSKKKYSEFSSVSSKQQVSVETIWDSGSLPWQTGFFYYYYSWLCRRLKAHRTRESLTCEELSGATVSFSGRRRPFQAKSIDLNTGCLIHLRKYILESQKSFYCKRS